MYTKHEGLCYGEYDFYERIGNNEIRIASLRGQLVGINKMFLYIHFPLKECSEIVLDLRYHSYDEVLKKAEMIIRKKMYKVSQDIISGLVSCKQ